MIIEEIDGLILHPHRVEVRRVYIGMPSYHGGRCMGRLTASSPDGGDESLHWYAQKSRGEIHGYSRNSENRRTGVGYSTEN